MEKPTGEVPVAVMGLGHVGREIARAAIASPGVKLIAALDADPKLLGKSLGELVPGAPDLVRVESDAHKALSRLKGGVLLLSTSSRFDEILPQLEAAAKAGVHVVSTCEELAFPWLNHEEAADRLDELAIAHEVSILGTGVNPGFVLDRLLATAGAVCGRVRAAHAVRVVDASTRRAALLHKIGAGLSEEAFDRKVESGEIGHVGLGESAALAVLGLGLDYDELEEEISPVLAEEDLDGPVPVKKGQVAGIYQRARGFLEGQEIVDLELTIAVGVDEAYDEIHIDAEPPVSLKVTGGYAGEAATAWAVVNAVPRVVQSEHGILTVLQLPAGR
ncbi:MAG: dihydrodipicolinate reductase [Myxococcales bacterium]